MKSVEITIQALNKEMIEIRWTKRLDLAQRPILNDLVECVERLEGVEFVDLRRYSATVVIAPHVARVQSLVVDIGKVFESDEFLHRPSVRFAGLQFDVKVFTDDVVRID